MSLNMTEKVIFRCTQKPLLAKMTKEIPHQFVKCFSIPILPVFLRVLRFQFADSIGIKSPTGMRGRSVKEIDEQLTNLRKENFNLKLRIYFLEERMGPNFNLDKESAVKRNVELMVFVLVFFSVAKIDVSVIAG